MQEQTSQNQDETGKAHLYPDKKGPTGKNAVTSNSPAKKPVRSEIQDIQVDDKPSPSTSGPKGTEEPGSDKGPSGTGW